MKLEFDPNEDSPRKWYASTDRGGYDAAGVSPIDAVSELVTVLETALGERVRHE